MSIRSFAALAAATIFVGSGFLTVAAPPKNPGTKPAPGGKPGKGKPGEEEPVDPEAPPPEPDPVEVREIFEVSRIGRPGAKESRDVLFKIYEELSARHAADMAAKKSEVTDDGVAFRILERMAGPESEGENLCLCEHGGGFCVVSFPDGAFPRGETTPQLEAEKVGLVSYRVKARRPFVEGAANPAAFSGSVAAFFGTLGVGVKPGLELEISPISADDPPEAAEAGPVAVSKFGVKYEDFTADVALPKWTAILPKVVEGEEELTRQQFVEDLRGGKKFEVLMEEERKCPVCFGFGRIADNRPEGRERDGKRDCTQCFGKKAILHKITYEVMWQR